MKRKLEEVGKLPKQFRGFTGSITLAKRSAEGEGEGAASDEPNLYDIAISSEAEVERWFGIEVLDHTAGAVDLTRLKSGGAVLVDHGGDQVGVVESVRLEDGVLRGSIRFSRSQRGREVEQDVADGIRRNVSVGYFVKAADKVEVRDGVDVWKVTRWMPAEVSIVSVPADITVGVGRNTDGGDEVPVAITDGVAVEEGERMMQSRKFNDGGAGGTGLPKPVVEVKGENREQRFREVSAIAAANGLSAADVEAYTRAGGEWENKALSDIAVDIASKRATKGDRKVPPSMEALGVGDIPAEDLERYSYHRAIRRSIEAQENPHNAKFDGVEAAVHRHIESNWPSDLPKRGGFFAPMRTRTLSSTQSTKGAEAVQERPGELIELLRARSIVLGLGARLLTGLTGPVGFPRVTGGVTVAWVPENPASDTPSSDPALGFAMLSPKTMQGVVPFTRQLAMQASFDIESWVRDELATGHSLVFDKAAIHGTGVNGQPTGIYNASGTFPKDFSATFPDASTLMDMVVGVADNNADLGTLGWLASVVLAGRLRVTQELGSTVGGTLWKENLREGTVLGYRASASTQASKTMNATGTADTGGTSQALIYGNWADLLVGMFGAMEFVVDPFTKKAKNIIEVATFQMGDVLPRHGQSFAKGINCPSA